MSDEDLKDYLEKMQAMSGRNIPGMDNDVKASDLTDEHLQTVRQALAKISEDMKNRQHTPSMQPPMPKAHLDSFSDDELVALLEDIQQKAGSLTELTASDDTDATALAEEQKQLDRDALMQMLQQYLLETALSAKMLYAEKAYSAAGQAVSI